ncbi:acyl carrier protein [Streptomyces pseudovenezuelae]|uniref:Act minimal PKS acyl carrier protein n=1 Tax=Streptomyces pseudovenezuelae TaxID=67350 RepID=A0ABT6LAY4_9ACTN|nr:acyl carrier protein [Streptomyces pseudovenezuelae]MDH6213145.1 act minimal PKS acyl carrier protein [Streptomyces pseudovenezuelae]
MDQLTTDRLMEIMRICAGEVDPVVTTADPEDIDFADLGYDSLALLETAGRLEREFGVAIGEGELADARTPADLTALINRLLAKTA